MFDPGGEIQIPLGTVQLCRDLIRPHLCHATRLYMCSPFKTGKDPQRSAMGGQFFNVKDPQARLGKDCFDRQQRQVGIMFVIDRVELDLFDEVEQMRKFNRIDRIAGQERGDPGREIIDIGHMRQHIGRGDQIGPPAFFHQFLGQRIPKEFDQGWHAFFLGDLCNIPRRFDPQNRDALLDEILQQIAVIRGDLGHQAVRSEAEAVGHLLGIGFAMSQPAI